MIKLLGVVLKPKRKSKNVNFWSGFFDVRTFEPIYYRAKPNGKGGIIIYSDGSQREVADEEVMREFFSNQTEAEDETGEKAEEE